VAGGIFLSKLGRFVAVSLILLRVLCVLVGSFEGVCDFLGVLSSLGKFFGLSMNF